MGRENGSLRQTKLQSKRVQLGSKQVASLSIHLPKPMVNWINPLHYFLASRIQKADTKNEQQIEICRAICAHYEDQSLQSMGAIEVALMTAKKRTAALGLFLMCG